MNKDKRTGWLADLKVGDKVIVNYSTIWHGRSRNVATVTKVTPTGRINTEKAQFLSGGRSIGDDRRYLSQATDELISEVMQENRHRHYRGLVGDEVKARVLEKDLLTTEQLQEIYQILLRGKTDDEMEAT